MKKRRQIRDAFLQMERDELNDIVENTEFEFSEEYNQKISQLSDVVRKDLRKKRKKKLIRIAATAAAVIVLLAAGIIAGPRIQRKVEEQKFVAQVRSALEPLGYTVVGSENVNGDISCEIVDGEGDCYTIKREIKIGNYGKVIEKGMILNHRFYIYSDWNDKCAGLWLQNDSNYVIFSSKSNQMYSIKEKIKKIIYSLLQSVE